MDDRRIAGMGRRFGAYLVDYLVGVIVYVGATFLGAALARAAISAGGYGWYLALVFLPTAAILVYGIVLLASQGGGGSLGMRLAGIRLVRFDTLGPAGFGRALGRSIVFSLAAGIVIGPFTPLFDATGAQRGWHDTASNTWAVRASGATALVRPSAPSAPASESETDGYRWQRGVPVVVDVPPVPPPSRGPELALAFLDGTVRQLTGTMLIGRNPEAAPGASVDGVIEVSDLGRSMSKTHARLELTGGVLTARDLNSTNGTRIRLPDGSEQEVGFDRPIVVPLGSVLAFGDETATVVSL